MIDSHCHLADKKFLKDLDLVITRARKAGVERIIAIADTLEEAKRCKVIAEKYKEIYWTAGVHPHHSSQYSVLSTQLLREMLVHPKCVAIGEIGLDYHYMNSPEDIQKKAFRSQLELAKELKKPVVMHCREAIEDIRAIVEDVQPPKFVLHCCTEKWENVEWILKRGFMLSFTGISTYPKAEDIRETIKRCPLKQMMIETDAPYLAPVPHRGKRNEPAFVTEVAKCVAKVKGISVEEVDRITTQNTIEFFSLAPVG